MPSNLFFWVWGLFCYMTRTTGLIQQHCATKTTRKTCCPPWIKSPKVNQSNRCIGGTAAHMHLSRIEFLYIKLKVHRHKSQKWFVRVSTLEWQHNITMKKKACRFPCSQIVLNMVQRSGNIFASTYGTSTPISKKKHTPQFAVPKGCLSAASRSFRFARARSQGLE